MHNLGATIVAHQNVLKRVSTTTRVEEWNYTFKPWPIRGRPTVLFTTEKILNFDGENIVLKNTGVSHTDGDISVYFSKADVLALGDIFWNGYYPFIDNGVGGGIDGAFFTRLVYAGV
jgi:glyoxylase-like metal-dependent hydrolase (beta-lactamase superfamily II)